jgi:hypothetical protein
VLAELPANVAGTDFAPLPVKSLDELKAGLCRHHPQQICRRLLPC